MKKNDSGRTLLEMLSTLAIMGVLTVVAVASYQYALNKKQANAVLNDAHLVQTLHLGLSSACDWTEESGFDSESAKTFYYKVDDSHNVYVKISGLEEKICKHLINLISGNLKLYNTNNTLLTTCGTTNDIIFDFDNTYNPTTTCTTSDDCTDGYCNEGTCTHCDGDLQVNSDKTACVCPDTMVSCSDDSGQQWCCGKNEENRETICGNTKDSCVVSDGNCQYNLSLQTKSSRTNCSYSLTASTKTRTNCSYSLSIVGNTVSWTEQQKCSDDTYCYLNYADKNCGTSASDSRTGIFYGNCLSLYISSSACPSAGQDIAWTKNKMCPASKYCELSWTSESHSTQVSDTSSGDIFGVCKVLE